MESCSLTTTLQEEQQQRVGGGGGCGGGRDSCESCESCESRESRGSRETVTIRDGQEVTSLEEAKSVIAALRARQRAQAHQMLAWRRTLKLQVWLCVLIYLFARYKCLENKVSAVNFE